MCCVTAVPTDPSDDLTSTPLSSETSTYEDLKFIERVIEVTRCHDRHLVSAMCAEAGYFDLDLVCSHVLAFMDGVRSSSGSTTSTSDGEHSAPSNKPAAAVGGAKAKSRGTRRQRKQEKKARAVQRRQANTAAATAAAAGGAGCHGRLGSCSDEDDASPFVISQQLKVLQI